MIEEYHFINSLVIAYKSRSRKIIVLSDRTSTIYHL